MGVGRTVRSKVVSRLTVVLALSLASFTTTLANSPPAGSTTYITPSPVSVSFLPSGEGWILSAYFCPAGTCITVARTLNAGKTWAPIAVPAQLQILANESGSHYFPFVQFAIYFANTRDGWIYGSVQPGTSNTGTYVSPGAALWSTHDGGDTWSPIRAKSLGMKFDILSLGAIRSYVYAIGWRTDDSFGLWRSTVATDSWQRVNTPALYSAAGGTSMMGAIVLKGTNGWLMVGNDRGVTGSARLTRTGNWVRWNGPCDSVGGTFAVPVATSEATLVDVCTIGGYGGGVAPSAPHNLKIGSNWLFTSRDGGLAFVPTNRIGVDNRTQWLDQLPGLPASPSPGVIIVAKTIEKGQSSVERLYSTRNGGKTWTAVYNTPTSSLYGQIQLVTFASPSLGSAIVQNSARTTILIISSDGGRTWHRTST